MTTLRQIRLHHFNNATKMQASSDWDSKMAANATSDTNRKHHLRSASMAQRSATWGFEAVQALNTVVTGAVEEDAALHHHRRRLYRARRWLGTEQTSRHAERQVPLVSGELIMDLAHLIAWHQRKAERADLDHNNARHRLRDHRSHSTRNQWQAEAGMQKDLVEFHLNVVKLLESINHEQTV